MWLHWSLQLSCIPISGPAIHYAIRNFTTPAAHCRKTALVLQLSECVFVIHDLHLQVELGMGTIRLSMQGVCAAVAASSWPAAMQMPFRGALLMNLPYVCATWASCKSCTSGIMAQAWRLPGT